MQPKRRVDESDGNTPKKARIQEHEPIQILTDDSDLDDDDVIEVIESTNKLLANPKQNTSEGPTTEKEDAKIGKSLKQAQCPICFDSVDVTIITPCGHLFCSDCIYQSLAHGKSSSRNKIAVCPLCRKNCKPEQTTYLKFKRKSSA